MSFLRFIIRTGAFAAVTALAGCAKTSQHHYEATKCFSQMRAICSASRGWAVDDGNDYLPSDLITASKYLVTPLVLHCPADDMRLATTNWTSFTLANSSYEIVTPHLRDMDRNGVFLRCRVHGYLGYADASVFDGQRRRWE